MGDRDTIMPPPPPRPSQRVEAALGLWLVCSPDAGRTGETLPLAGRITCTVGRGDDATFCVDDHWQSRAHFRLDIVADGGMGSWAVQDLGTRNGTFLNGHKLAGQAALHPGDVLRAGSSVLVFANGDKSSDDMGLVGWSAALAGIRARIGRAATGNRPVHVLGESGVGKEVVARAIHERSPRAKGPFLALNMATLVENLAESQLFGHKRGAFSGASADQQGVFDAAHGGTLLLDEIGELSLPLQAKLLRAVESGEVQRVGDARAHRVDVRLITATHRDLEEMVAQGSFRQDLFWRLAHGGIRLPPLRDRRLDVVPLVDHFLALAGSPPMSKVVLLHPQASWYGAELMEHYLIHHWPGNVRELRQEVGQLAEIMAARRDDQLTGPIPPLEEVLGARVRPGQPGPVTTPAPAPVVDPAERLRIEGLLADAEALAAAIRSEEGGNIKGFAVRAAQVLGKSPASVRRAVYRRLGPLREALRED